MAVRWPSGGERQRSESRRAPLNWASQRQRWGRCKVRRRAERVSRPAMEKNRRRRVLVVTICSPRPMRVQIRARFPGDHALQGAGAVETMGLMRPRGEMVRSHANSSISAWRLVGLQTRVSPSRIDEAAIAVAGEDQLGTGRGLHAPHRRGVPLALEGSVAGFGHVGGALHPVGDGRPVLLGYGRFSTPW